MSILDDIAVCDFESAAIGPRPDEYPPKPVGLAIRHPGGGTEYLSWGSLHNDNNCTEEEAKRAWLKACQGPVLFHNGAFDIEVAVKWWKVPWPRVWHDTLFLAYLYDPYAVSLSLKPLAANILGIAPVEQDDLRDWIVANVPGATRSNFGAHICKAPVALVSPYAIGDVERTYALFEHLYPQVMETQPNAYLRELRLCPHLLQAEKRGIRVDRPLLQSWRASLEPAIVRCDELIAAALNVPSINVDSNDELIAALDNAKVMLAWQYTDGLVIPTGIAEGPSITNTLANAFAASSDDNGEVMVAPGKRSVSKGALRRWCRDTNLVNTLEYRNTCATLLRTFIDPWLELSRADGRLHCKWHQVRGMEANGTRTGRISSAEPNLANVVNPVGIKPPLGCPFLPSLRAALLPEDGHVWVSLDFSQQELRWAAHFEDKALLQAYAENPDLDMHQYASDLILKLTGKVVTRKQAKTIAFATLYGAGIKELARQLECSEDEASEVRTAYFMAVPGLKALSQQVQERARLHGYIRSGGGRTIKVEPPKLVKGRMRSFEYRMLNYLVQGTAADQTKQAIIDFCMLGTPGLLTTTVYDEINLSVPRDQLKEVTNALAGCMLAALPCDVQHRVDVEVGNSWGSLVDVPPGSTAKHILELVDAR